jgi:hypothetical protein
VTDEIITLWRYRDLPEALFAQGKLEAAGVDSVLLDQNLVLHYWYLSDAIGGLRLQVAAADAQTAMEVLSDEIPASFTAEEIGEEYTQPVCPECGSRDVDFRTFSRGWALVALYVLALPLPIPVYKWKCQDCGRRWRAPYD